MLLWFIVLCILATTILYAINSLVRGGRKGKLIDKIPGPYAWPVIGNVFQYVVPLDKLWDAASRLNSKYYPVNRIWALHVPVVNIYHPDDVEAVLSSTKHIQKSRLYHFFHPWLGTGLLTSNGEKWHVRRRILTPGFHFNVLQQFVRIFMEQSEKLTQSLCLEGDEVVPDLVSILHKYTLNSICETAMGSSSDVDVKILDEYRSCVSKMGDILVHRLIRPWLHSERVFKFFGKFKEQVRLLRVLHGFSIGIINERKRYHAETNGQHLQGLDNDGSYGLWNFEEEPVEGKRRLAMLDLLISAQNQGADLDDIGIREEVDTFIFEGHDTTAMALCFILLLLAENKEIQDKARAEVDEIFDGKERGKLSLRELQRLAYLERCIKESLRLFPSVPFIARDLIEDVQLKDYLVPAGTIIHIFIRDLHRDPNFWPNPNVFDPDRFSPDQSQGRHPFSFVPFSAGSRNCIGQRFAMLELKALVGTFLHNFNMEPIDLSSNIRILPDMVLRPMTPIRIKLVRRSHDN